MLITELNLTSFRNFSSLHFNFSPFTTVIVGDNASGKTNILESIFVLAFGKSFRAKKEAEMIRWGEEISRVSAVVNGSNWTNESNRTREETKLEVVLTTGLVQGKKVPSKKYLVNDISRRWADFIGNLKVVLFSPEDIQLVSGEPSLRRNYLDTVLSGVERNYWRISRAYQKVVYQRNRLLEQINKNGARSDQLDFWDEQLVSLGNLITQRRENYLNFLNKQPKKEKHLKWMYDPSVISMEKIKNCRARDISAMMTLSGPHRDDFRFLLNDRDLASFGSRGQQRTAVLALKMGELEYLTCGNERKPFTLQDKVQGKPILLLDDIFSELDENNRRKVLAVIGQQQTIITTTDLHFIEDIDLAGMEIWRVKDGGVIRLPA